MRILITGGFGFIGGRLGQHLQGVGHQVILGTRNPSGPPDWLPQAEVGQTDWNDFHTLEKVCTSVDVVIHAAGMNAQDCAANPLAALELNGLATARMIVAASCAKAKRFIYLSTAHVYSSPLVGIITEDTCPCNLHPYATSHLAGENAVLGASQSCQIEGIVLRLSNTFGAPAHRDVNCWTLLVNDLCRQAVQKGKMALRTGGLQQRDFIAMEKVCRTIQHLSSCTMVAPQPYVFNVGSGVSQSILGMAQLVQMRCKDILSFEPELVWPTTDADESIEALEYRQDRLGGLISNGEANCAIEIDHLLTFCHDAFKHSLGSVDIQHSIGGGC